MIASELVDSIPLSTAADVNLHPAKKQALDQEIQSIDLSHKHEELSVVCKLVFYVTEGAAMEILFLMLTHLFYCNHNLCVYILYSVYHILHFLSNMLT